MRFNPNFYRWSPNNTPPAIRNLIWITVSTILLAAILGNLFHFLGLMGPEEFFGLSWSGLQRYFLWQPLTYLFVQQSAGSGIHFLYLVSIFVNMYLLWLLGTMIAERSGTNHFLALYFLSGILAGLTAMLVNQYGLISGPGAAILAVCMVWTMYYSDSEITIFFLFPVQAKWLMTGVLGAVSILTLAQFDVVSFVLYISGAIYGYLYGLLVLNIQGPFEFLLPIDRLLTKLGQWVRSLFGYQTDVTRDSSKIIDLRGKIVVDDEEFIDSMLDKIAKHGEDSLSNAERKRMDQISERKARERMDR
jgi:membrane associated rhomboid family serine protease